MRDDWFSEQGFVFKLLYINKRQNYVKCNQNAKNVFCFVFLHILKAHSVPLASS